MPVAQSESEVPDLRQRPSWNRAGVRVRIQRVAGLGERMATPNFWSPQSVNVHITLSGE